MEIPFCSTHGDPQRRAILSAVAKVLVDKKSHALEMQEVVEQSGCLYDDVARTFSDLDDVLLSLVQGVSKWIVEPLGSETERVGSRDEMLAILTEFGRRYAHANATILPGIFRIFLTESSRRASLARKFYDAGPAVISGALIDLLQGVKEVGVADFPDSSLTAEALMGLLREPLYCELAIHSKQLASGLSSADRAPDVVRLFVEGCSRRQGR